MEKIGASIRIGRFEKERTEALVDDSDPNPVGMYIPDLIYWECEISNADVRNADMQNLNSCAVLSSRQGDNAYVHCMTGLARAPVGATVLAAILMDINYWQSCRCKDDFWNIQSGRKATSMEGRWINRAIGAACAFFGRVFKPEIQWINTNPFTQLIDDRF